MGEKKKGSRRGSKAGVQASELGARRRIRGADDSDLIPDRDI